MELSGGMIMSKIFMVYASQTGNTEIITDILEEQLNKQGHEVVVKSFDFDDIPMDALVDYDAVLIGTYTWDDGELPYEVEDFYNEMEDIDLTGHIIGVYGSADSFRSEEHTSELQSRGHLVCRLLLEKKKKLPQLITTTIR